jgi:hypothetical protein
LKRSACAALVAAAAFFSACGGHGGPAPSTSRCTAKDTALQCNLPPAPAQNPFQAQRAVARGIDFGWGGPSVGTFRANGWTFGASYLSTDLSKNWHVGQAKEYAAAGIARVFVWETTAARSLSGCSGGRSDAGSAWSQSRPLNARVIYFAVDFELQPSEVSAVKSYFRCASQVIGVNRTGAYGGIFTISTLFNSKLIGYGWQTYAWSGGRWDGRAQLQQWLNGNSFDYDRAVAPDYGQTPFAAKKPVKKPSKAAVLALEARVRTIRAELGAAKARVKRLAGEGHNTHAKLNKLVGRVVAVR